MLRRIIAFWGDLSLCSRPHFAALRLLYNVKEDNRLLGRFILMFNVKEDNRLLGRFILMFKQPFRLLTL